MLPSRRPTPLAALLLTLSLAGCASFPFFGSDPMAPVSRGALTNAAERAITPDAVLEHIAYLAADEMRGRATPSPELERAAEYIADHFAAIGLEPAGDPGSYMQRWTIQELVLDRERSRAGVRTPVGERSWEYANEYFAIPGPPSPVNGAPVYAASPEAVGGGLPPDVSTRPLVVSLPDGLDEGFGLVIQAALIARAAGLVLIMDEETDASDIFQIAAALEAGAAGQLPIPVIGLRHDVGEAFLREAGVPAGVPMAPPSILLETNISIQTEFTESSVDVPNVVGMIRGSHPELSEEYVVLTAHFDHVGVGPPDATGDSIYSGADDNASGTSALMQIAAAFAELPRAPPRSVVFLAVSGEEKGLLGSAHYAAEPTVPAESILANLNMDMVGRNHPDSLFAVGEEYSTIGASAQRVLADRPELALVLAPDPEPEEQAFLRSDHFSFVQQGIPALMLTTWLHDDYHLPSDRVEAIDSDKVARVARFIFYLTYDLAADPLAPDWTDEGRALLQNLPMF